MMKHKLFKEPARARVFLRAGSLENEKQSIAILNSKQERR